MLGFNNDAANTDTDLAVFQALGNGILSDKFGTFTTSSTTGDTNSWSDTAVTQNDGKYQWTTYRAAAATTASKDVTIPCGSKVTYSWRVTKPSTQNGTWELDTNSDCSVNDPPAASAAGLTVAGTVAMGVVLSTLF